jgi:hypothetical protein
VPELDEDDVVEATDEDVDSSLADVELVKFSVVEVVAAAGLVVPEPVDGTSELVVADGTLVVVEFNSELVVLEPSPDEVPGDPLGAVLPGGVPFEPGGAPLAGLVVLVELAPGLMEPPGLEPDGELVGEVPPGLPVPVPLGTVVVGLVVGVVVGVVVDGELEWLRGPLAGLPPLLGLPELPGAVVEGLEPEPPG